MESFSERKGLKPIKSVMQVDSMDEDLRTGLWNALTVHYWNLVKPLPHVTIYSLSYASNHDMKILVHRLWMDHFKKPVDEIGQEWHDIHSRLRTHFFQCPWNEVYDFVEFVANNYPRDYVNQDFIKDCNVILGTEVSAYRFVGDRITQITSEEEIREVETGLESGPETSKTHLKVALDLLSDRKSPDYRNSIKESISAVESICKSIAGDEKATLDRALEKIELTVGLHPALKKAFSKLYGYTSNAQGIRHALMNESKLDFEDAKFMLVACSAFVNYLIVKASKADIKL